MAVAVAVVFAILAGIAKKAKMDKVSKAFGLIAFLTFMGWLASGPGFALLNWINSPSVDVPSLDINR